MRDMAVEEAYDAVTELRQEPPDALIWEVAIRDHWVAEYINEEITLEDLVEYLDRSTEFAGTLKQVKRDRARAESREEPENLRRWAINRIFAIEADDLDVVRAFRTEWLSDGLLGMDEVEDWIMHRKSMEGAASSWITTLADDNGNPVTAGQDRVGYAESSRLVRFVVPDRDWIRVEPVNAYGALIELASVAEMLHRRYDWSEAWAATFVLTGTVPPALLATWTASEPWPWHKARRRMTITVRLDVQPPQLLEMYREKRGEMLRGEPMPRAISEHKARLAVFAARHSKGFTWGETMRKWNRENPQNEFTSEPQFTRDSRDAFNRVMGEPLNWQGKGEEVEGHNGTH